jgi:pilus assembly protein CpaF
MRSAAPPDPRLVDAVRSRLDDVTRPRPDRDHREVDLHAEVRQMARHVAPLLEPTEYDALVRRVHSEMAGLGALDELLGDPLVQEVMVNAGREVWVDRAGRLSQVGDLAPGVAEVLLERILAPLGRRLDRLSPTVDARLPDGSRVCAAIAPVSPDGPTISIRRFAVHAIPLDQFAPPSVVHLLREVIDARCNVVVAGATSSGKTTLLNALTGLLAPGERIVTLEDTAELRLTSPHVVRLEARAATADGVPAVGLDHLLRTALRLRPDRLVVGEVRGAEAVALLQALSTGHDGSMATLHANDAADALRRLEVLVLQGAPSWPLDAVRQQVHASVDVVVQVARGERGKRRIVEVAEMADDGSTSTARLRRLADADRVIAALTRRRHDG